MSFLKGIYLVLVSLEVLEVSYSVFCDGIIKQQLLDERTVPCLELLCCWGMSTREVMAVHIMLQEKRLEVCQCVFLTEESPYAILIIYITAVELVCFQFLELADEVFTDSEVLFAVSPWRLVLMVADTLTEEVGHLEVRIAE